VKVYKLRESLLKLIFESENHATLVDLPIAHEIKKELLNVFNMQDYILDYLDSQTDFEMPSNIQKVMDFSLNMDALRNYDSVLSESDMNVLLNNMKAKMKKVLPKLSEDLKKMLVGSLIL